MPAPSPFPTACMVLAGGLLAAPAGGQPRIHEIRVESPAMASGETMPRRYTPDGHNVSPPITWTALPEGARELAVVCADFGAGSPPPWVHWVVYGIPATAGGLPEGLPILPDTPMPAELAGAIQGLNGWRRPYYRGPAPPGRHAPPVPLHGVRPRRGPGARARPDPPEAARGDGGPRHRAGRPRTGLRTVLSWCGAMTNSSRHGRRDSSTMARWQPLSVSQMMT